MAQTGGFLHISLKPVVLLRLYLKLGGSLEDVLIFRDAVSDFVKQTIDNEDENEKDKDSSEEIEW